MVTLYMTHCLQIFTEPLYMEDYYFKNFYNSKTRGNWRVSVYSYYYVYKFVADPRQGFSAKAAFSGQGSNPAETHC